MSSRTNPPGTSTTRGTSDDAPSDVVLDEIKSDTTDYVAMQNQLHGRGSPDVRPMTTERSVEGDAPRVFTVGHSTRDFDEVLAMLRANDVNELVDVRSFPSSRKFPQWNQEAIQHALPTDIGYRWIKDLGGRRHTPAGVESLNGAWRVKAFRDYADYMATESFRSGLAELLQVANRSTPTIMCSEAVPWRCHRRLVTDALIVEGIEVYNIMSVTSTQRAALTEFAHVEDRRITYPTGGETR